MSAVKAIESPGSPQAPEFVKSRPGDLPYYRISDKRIPYGMSLGNHKLWVPLKASRAIDSVFSVDVGQYVSDAIVLTYAIPSNQLMSMMVERAEEVACDGQFTLMQQEGPGTIEIHPSRQVARFRLSGELDVTETVLLPKTGDIDPPVMFHNVAVMNRALARQTVRITSYIRMAGKAGHTVRCEWDERIRALVFHEEDHPGWVCCFGGTAPDPRYETTFDSSQIYADSWSRCLRNDATAHGSVLGAVQADLEIEPQKTKEICFVLSFSPEGEDAARDLYRSHQDYHQLLADTVEYLRPTVSVATVETPDPIINEGVFWAKTNMLRVMGAYPQGLAFTNNPGNSSMVVARDVVWYTHACDYLLPGFSRELLSALARFQGEDGKIPEAYHAISGEKTDYGLNINDDTPLFIIGVHHHYLATGSEEFLREIYPAARKAGEYLLSQRDDRGLVSCSATGTGTEGIASWRNVITGYQINGAVTEINAECYAALTALAHLADVLAEGEAARHFEREAARLKQAINGHLLNHENGMYYLNIDTEGNVHTEVTADEVFPVMFGVADSATSYRIISRLNAPDFMTPAGLRTSSRESPEYEPMKHVGLMGGVWPGVTFWYAFAAAPYHPAFMAESLHRSYEHYLRDPLANYTLPGEFSEWFDGESLTNRGMQLSPWEPPRLLWAAVEGACGVRGQGEACRCSPLIPPEWQWIGLRRLPQGGRNRSFFVGRQRDGLHVYTDGPVITEYPYHEYEQDVSNAVRVLDARAHRLALSKPGEVAVCVGTSAEGTVVVPIRIHGLLKEDARYDVTRYNSELREWQAGPVRRGRDLHSLAIPIDSRGFRVIRIVEA